MRFIKKLFAFFLVFNMLFSLSAPYVLAEITGDEVGNAVREKLMESFRSETGADSQATKNSVQSLNVSRQKKQPPQVALTFTPTNPVPGEVVTASAVSTYFMNDPNFHYYTWFLQHNTGKAESTDSEGRKTKDGNTDWDENGRIDVEDYKIEAMRIVANGGFDWQRAMGSAAPLCLDSTISSSQKPDYCGLTNQYTSAVTTVSDDDGYDAVPGGDDQRATPSKPFHQYLHNFSSGDEYEFAECSSDGSNKCNHLFPTAPGETTGDGRFTLEEEEFWHTNPASKDTAGSGTTDEAAVAGLGKFILKWNYATGDKVGVVVEGISVESSPYADSSYMTMWALPKNMCTAEPKTSTREDQTTTVVGESTYVLTGETAPVLDSATGLPQEDPITHEPITTPTYYKSVEETVYTKTYTDGPYVVDNDHGSGPSEIETTTVYTQVKHYAQDLTELFTISADGSGYTYSSSAYETVDRTNLPELTTTGTSAIFKARSSVQDINDCLEDNMMEPSEGTANQKMEINLSYSPNAPVNSFDGNNSDQLGIQSSIVGAENKEFLNYAWQIYLSSDITAAEKDWRLLTLANLGEQKTGVKKLSGIGLNELQIKLNFSKNFLEDLGVLTSNSDIFYAKVMLRAIEGVGAKKKEGVGTVLIPIQLSTNSLQIFSTNVSESNLAISLNTDNERCSSTTDTNSLEAINCPVAKNEIIGAKFAVSPSDLDDYEFLWSFDNLPLAETDKNIAYFPILAERNTQHTLALNASNKVTGEKVTLIKSFKVSDPTISIKSLTPATCAPTLLGYYIDPINVNPNPDPGANSNQWPDLSDNAFEALPGETIELKPDITPRLQNDTNWFSAGEPTVGSGYENKTWFMDGIAITPVNMQSLGVTEIRDDGTLVFLASKPVGQKYNISFGSLYVQPSLVKRALNATWEVPQTSFYEKNISKSIEVTVTETLSGSRVSAQSKTPQQKIMASLFSAIPSYVTFLFRVVLTMGLVLFLVKILFSLFPKQNQA